MQVLCWRRCWLSILNCRSQSWTSSPTNDPHFHAQLPPDDDDDGKFSRPLLARKLMLFRDVVAVAQSNFCLEFFQEASAVAAASAAAAVAARNFSRFPHRTFSHTILLSCESAGAECQEHTEVLPCMSLFLFPFLVLCAIITHTLQSHTHRHAGGAESKQKGH